MEFRLVWVLSKDHVSLARKVHLSHQKKVSSHKIMMMTDVTDETLGTTQPRGRTSVRGTHRAKPKYVRRAYSYGAKQAIFRELETHGLDKVIKTHWSGHTTGKQRREICKLLYKWKAKRAKIDAVAATEDGRNARKARPSGLGCVLSQEMEDDIGLWVRSLREEGVPVSQQMIMLKVLFVSNEEGLAGFAASYDWLDCFKRRHGLSLRARGTHGQQAPENIREIAEKFAGSVIEVATRLDVQEIWNADETAVFFEFLPRKTVDERGTRTVWVRCAGAEKRRFSVLLLGSSAGRKKDPFIVMKEVPSRTPEGRAENEQSRHGFGPRVWQELADLDIRDKVFANKTGWLTGPLIVQWLDIMFGDDFTTKKLLLLDEFSGHWTDDVLKKCEALNITLLRIPAGCTSVCQPADVAWNRPFKAQLRKLWVDRLIRIVANNEQLTPPARIEVCKWVQMAWGSLETIKNGFRISTSEVNTDRQVGELARAVGMVELREESSTED